MQEYRDMVNEFSPKPVVSMEETLKYILFQVKVIESGIKVSDSMNNIFLFLNNYSHRSLRVFCTEENCYLTITQLVFVKIISMKTLCISDKLAYTCRLLDAFKADKIEYNKLTILQFVFVYFFNSIVDDQSIAKKTRNYCLISFLYRYKEEEVYYVTERRCMSLLQFSIYHVLDMATDNSIRFNVYLIWIYQQFIITLIKLSKKNPAQPFNVMDFIVSAFIFKNKHDMLIKFIYTLGNLFGVSKKDLLYRAVKIAIKNKLDDFLLLFISRIDEQDSRYRSIEQYVKYLDREKINDIDQGGDYCFYVNHQDLCIHCIDLAIEFNNLDILKAILKSYGKFTWKKENNICSFAINLIFYAIHRASINSSTAVISMIVNEFAGEGMHVVDRHCGNIRLLYVEALAIYQALKFGFSNLLIELLIKFGSVSCLRYGYYVTMEEKCGHRYPDVRIREIVFSDTEYKMVLHIVLSFIINKRNFNLLGIVLLNKDLVSDLMAENIFAYVIKRGILCLDEIKDLIQNVIDFRQIMEGVSSNRNHLLTNADCEVSDSNGPSDKSSATNCSDLAIARVRRC